VFQEKRTKQVEICGSGVECLPSWVMSKKNASGSQTTPATA